MSFMDKIKSFFSGESSGAADSPAAMDPMAEPASTSMGDPAAAPMPPVVAADPAGMPTTDAAEHSVEDGHDHSGHDHSEHDHTH